MTTEELRTQYEAAYRIIRREKAMRLKVFRNRPTELTGKVAEMDRLLDILRRFKDELKPHCEPGYSSLDSGPHGQNRGHVEQATLVDVPRKIEYR